MPDATTRPKQNGGTTQAPRRAPGVGRKLSQRGAAQRGTAKQTSGKGQKGPGKGKTKERRRGREGPRTKQRRSITDKTVTPSQIKKRIGAKAGESGSKRQKGGGNGPAKRRTDQRGPARQNDKDGSKHQENSNRSTERKQRPAKAGRTVRHGASSKGRVNAAPNTTRRNGKRGIQGRAKSDGEENRGAVGAKPQDGERAAMAQQAKRTGDACGSKESASTGPEEETAENEHEGDKGRKPNGSRNEGRQNEPEHQKGTQARTRHDRSRKGGRAGLAMGETRADGRTQSTAEAGGRRETTDAAAESRRRGALKPRGSVGEKGKRARTAITERPGGS